MFRRVICLLLIFSLVLNVYHFTKVQAMSVSAVAGIGILASMLIAGGYLVYQNRDSAFALLSNVWDSLPPRTRDAILWPWEAGRKVVKYGSEVWSEVVRVLLDKKGLSLRADYDLPISSVDELDLNVLDNYHYYEVLDDNTWRYWYFLYPVSDGQVELFLDQYKEVITFQRTEMAPEPYIIRIDRYRLEGDQYVLWSSLERAASYVGIYRDYWRRTNEWTNFNINVYDSRGSQVANIAYYGSGRWFLSILDGSFSYRREVLYNPAAGDVQVMDNVLPEDAANKDVSVPSVTDLSGLMSFLSTLVGVTSDTYRDVLDLTRGISDYVGSIYDVLTTGLTNLISGVRSIANVLTDGLIGDLSIDYQPLLDLPLTTKFPFSLPFDVYSAISGFSSEGDLPELNFGFYDPVNKTIIDNRIDLGSIDFVVQYAPYVRAVLLFVYVLGLVYATRRLLGGGV